MKRRIICALVGMIGLSASSAYAASGDSTFSIGYANVQFSGLKGVIKDISDKNKHALDGFATDYLTIWERQHSNVGGYEGKAKNPQGINLKYRYEITDELGVITSFTWARSKSSSQNTISQNWENVNQSYKGMNLRNPVSSAKTDITSSYLSFLAGPTYRLNKYVSLYAMAGVGVAKVDADLNVKGNIPGRESVANSFSDSSSMRKSSFAWSTGAQFNLNESVAMDVTYEGSGSGDLRTNGILVDIGLKF